MCCAGMWYLDSVSGVGIILKEIVDAFRHLINCFERLVA